MNNFMENLKLYGTVLIMVCGILTGTIAAGKGKLDQHIKDTVAQEIQPIKDTQENILKLLKICASEKQLEQFEKEKQTENALKGSK